MACEFLLWESYCVCSGHVELIVTVQAQHENNRKYSNSYTINDNYRQTVVFIDFAMQRK